MIEKTVVYAVLHNDVVKHIRMTKEIAAACADIERSVYGFDNVKVIPVAIVSLEPEE